MSQYEFTVNPGETPIRRGLTRYAGVYRADYGVKKHRSRR